MAKALSFEDALAKLEETARRLEAGNLPLNESVALFEQGTKLAQLCNQYLDAAELKVSMLVQTAAGDDAEQAMAVDGDEAGETEGEG